MGKCKTLIRLIKTKKGLQKALFLNWSQSALSHIVTDEAYIKIHYSIYMGKKLDLENPRSFNEKLQWLKLYDRNSEYTKMADKYEAKRLFAEKFGKEHVITTYGVWNSFDEINFDSLPDKFVLKCTHDSGSIAICRDKSKFDFNAARKILTMGLKKNGYWYGREWPYKNIKPRIIAEKYMEEKDSSRGMVDYKFYCFNGKPLYLYVSEGLENHDTARISFFTPEWQFAPFGRTDYRPFSELPKKPEHFEQMLEIASKASENMTFLRVDLYEINGVVYFSEFTFTPNSGYMPFEPEGWDEKLGELLTLPKKRSGAEMR